MLEFNEEKLNNFRQKNAKNNLGINNVKFNIDDNNLEQKINEIANEVKAAELNQRIKLLKEKELAEEFINNLKEVNVDDNLEEKESLIKTYEQFLINKLDKKLSDLSTSRLVDAKKIMDLQKKSKNYHCKLLKINITN